MRCRLLRDGEQIAATDAPEELTGTLAAVVRQTAELLAPGGERLRAGEVVICGSILPPLPVAPGERITAEIEPLGVADRPGHGLRASRAMDTRLLIGGELVPGNGPALAVEDPAHETALAEVGTPDAEQHDAAVEAARDAPSASGPARPPPSAPRRCTRWPPGCARGPTSWRS